MYSSTQQFKPTIIRSIIKLFKFATLLLLTCSFCTVPPLIRVVDASASADASPDAFPDPAPVSLPGAEPSLGAGANPLLLDSLVKRLPKKGDKKEILISYLAAVPTLIGEIDQYLLNISASNSAQSSSKDRENITKKLTQAVHCLTTDAYVSVVSGALVAALVEINNDPTILPNHQLKYVFGNTCGNDSHSTRLFMEHWQAGARVFIGPEKNCKTEASMAASQNLPIISYRCNDQDISREDYHYRTFARTVPPSGEIFKAFLALLKEHNWRKFSVVYDVKKDQSRNELFETLKRVMEEENQFEDRKYEILNVSRLEFHKMDIGGPVDTQKIQDAVKDTMHSTRIYLTFDNVRLFRIMLNAMGEMGLTTKGYTLIYVDTNYDWLNVYHAMNNHFLRNTMTYLTQSWDADNSSDRKMLEYSRMALSIIPTPVKLNSQKFYTFWKNAGEYIHYFGVQKTDNLKGNRIACYLYDAVYLYARAVHELVEDHGKRISGYDPTADGKAIIDRIVNRKYRSIQGFDMRIDSKGNSKGNFSLLSWQKVKPVMNKTDPKYYPIDHALDLTAIFVEGAHKERLPILSFKNSQIHWILDDGPPLDEPVCGFNEEKCDKGDRRMLISILLSIPLVIFLVVMITIRRVSRSRKFENELASIWKIEPMEVQKAIGGNESTASLLAETNGPASDNKSPWFTEMQGSGMRGIAYYKGTLVAIKEFQYNRKMKELPRTAKKELRVMRQLSHPNLNNFLGIILLDYSLYSVREFCSKGSLLDVLRNSDMKLDHLYIASFIEDLVKGMIYIHDSELKVHGNLKSTNCLITSRWTLQIADYGLEEVRDGLVSDQLPAVWESFLWTAPEAMVVEGMHVHRRMPTQKADVWSFGVILHEIFTRNGPYQLCVEREGLLGSNNNCSDKSWDDQEFEHIVRKVYNDPNFRPNVDNLEVQNYVKEVMVSCWNREPEKRPEFKSGVRSKLKPLFHQIYKRNIMDHMIVMMEKYQTQLEGLVEERTVELREEQERSEHLLQRMLPRSVADQLLAGQDVIPEAFPPVTIYFSDIVGFTTIAGDSTPMQIVAFLNKLYTLFDRIIGRYDVYKVETIGDAYMVVSGVPRYQTMEYHAEQIAMMALHILSAVRSFSIPHRKEEQLMIRIGLHTGPCAAGVVGKTMPRYTLFGDTVNTASRMESNGQALKIHCSSSMRNALRHIPGFVLEERGLMPIKGKGDMTTYWLKGRRDHEFVKENLDAEKEKKSDIFPRQLKHRGSSWGVNRDSSLSLATDKAAAAFLKRSALTRNQDSLAHFQTSNREMPSLCEDDAESIFGSRGNLPMAAQIGQIGPIRGRKRSAANRKFSSTISNSSSRMNTFEHDNLAMRKRSTSLPDGDNLNLDFLDHTTTSISHPSVPIATIAPCWNTSPKERMILGSGQSGMDSTDHSQYPSYRDLVTIPHQRKRGIATVYPIRKRSLSCGDALPQLNSVFLSEEVVSCGMMVPGNRDEGREVEDQQRPLSPEEQEDGQVDEEKSLIADETTKLDRNRSLFDRIGSTPSRSEDGLRSCPQHRRKNKRSFFRDASPLARRIREASPFAKNKRTSKPFLKSNSSSRGDSLTRMFRRWRGDNEYSDLNDDYDFCEEEGFEMQTRKPMMEVKKAQSEIGRANRSVSCSPIEGGNSTDNSEPLLTLPTLVENATSTTTTPSLDAEN